MPMEQLLHYVWKHKLFATAHLKTTEGVDVEVIDVGLHNDNAGADFFNAKVKLGDTLWVGLNMGITTTRDITMWCYTWWERPTWSA